MVAILAQKVRERPVVIPLSKKKLIEECKVLLTDLPEGIYCMDWHGQFPKFPLYNHDSSDSSIMVITVYRKLNIKEILQFKKQFFVKKTKICDNNINCIELWTKEQLSQLIARLKDTINGTYYY